MDSEPLAFLTPSPAEAERLRALIEAESGIILTPDAALRFGAYLLQAAVLLARTPTSPPTG